MKSDDEKEDGEIEVSYRNMWQFTHPYLKGRKLLIAGAFLFTMISVAFTAMAPMYIGKIVDAMVESFSGDNSQWNLIWQSFWIIVGLNLFSSVFKTCGLLLMHIFASAAIEEVASDAIYKVQRFNSHWHANSFVGGTTRKIARGMWSPLDLSYALIMGILPAIFVIIAVEVVVASKLPMASWALGISTVLYAGASVFFSVKILRPMFKSMFEQDTKFNSELSDLVTGNQIVKSFSAEIREDKLIGSTLKELKRKIFKAFAVYSGIDGVRALMDFCIYASSLTAVVFMWKDGRATPGDIAFIISSASIITGYLAGIGHNVTSIQRSFNAMEEVVGLWLRDEEVKNIEGALPLKIKDEACDNKIVFKDVGFCYPKTDKAIFSNFSVQIAKGEKVALVGTSGSGKSTFVKLLQRLYNLDRGFIYIDGQNIAEVTLESLRSSISLVPQDPVLFHRSLRENIAYGKPGASDEEVIAAAKKAHAHDFISGLSKGYDTLVGERGIKLSGGERQRVAIARAILADKPILIMDEATSSLDSVSEFYIKKAMDTLTQGKTTITIAHRLSTIKNSDRILVFDAGKIIEQGKHDALMSHEDSKYKELYDTQSLGFILKDNGKDNKEVA